MGKLEDNLLAAVIEHGSARVGKLKNLNTILMKFSKVEQGFEECRDVFKQFDKDGNNGIDFGEMKEALTNMGVKFTEEQVKEVFDTADFDHNKTISFTEFIVALVMLHLTCPDVHVGDDHTKFTAAVEVVIDAFLFFDKNQDGCLEQEEVMEVLAASEKGGGAGELKERFAEMDWDSNGTISFVEFLHAFESWVGLEDADPDAEA